MPTNFPRRGEIYFAQLDTVLGSEQGGRRPVLVIQNDVNNEFSPVTIIASITSAPARRANPVDVLIEQPGTSGLRPLSRILLNQLKTVDKRRLEEYVGQLSAADMKRVDRALSISIGLTKT
jgi:mRNA interferase MazF